MGTSIDTHSWQNLIEAARAAAKHSYSPYSNFPVGAAILSTDGRIFSGCNIENASYGLTNCAERTAMFQAAAHGVRKISALVVYTPTAAATAPCGACRQVLNEFGPECEVLCVCEGSGQIKTRLNLLLPDAFGPGNLPQND